MICVSVVVIIIIINIMIIIISIIIIIIIIIMIIIIIIIIIHAVVGVRGQRCVCVCGGACVPARVNVSPSMQCHECARSCHAGDYASVVVGAVCVDAGVAMTL